MTGPGPISSPDELVAALQLAVGVELSTIPVYLTALYSIEDGHNIEAAQTIRSVVMEEMLHMTLAANVLNALGHPPSTAPVVFKESAPIDPVPAYPLNSPLISGLGTLELLRFSPEAVASFTKIEHPWHGATTPPGPSPSSTGYQTIGQFYDAISTALEQGHGTFGHGLGSVPDTQYYGGAGEVIQVVDENTAKLAINKIVAEGEGLPPAHMDQAAKQSITDGDRLNERWQMYSHYARFRELQFGRRYLSTQSAGDTPTGAALLVDYDAVHPALYNKQQPDTVEGAAVIEFDLAYSKLVDDLYRAFSGGPQSRFPQSVHAMYRLKNMAVGLMRTPNPVDRKHTLCPRFRYLAEAERTELRKTAETLRGRAK